MNLSDAIAQGFDESVLRNDYCSSRSSVRIRCSQCEAAVINGTPCHENGCPNIPRPVPECCECGCELEGPDGHGHYHCSCQDPVEGSDGDDDDESEDV